MPADQAEKLRELARREHSPFGGSSLGRLYHCPGSYALIQATPVESLATAGEDADEGTQLHAAVASGDLTGLDEEQAEAVAKCRAAIEDYQALGYEGETEVRVEYTLAGEHVWGTADYRGRVGAVAALSDWKFTREPLDDVAVSLQIQSYALPELEAGSVGVDVEVYAPRTGERYQETYRQEDAPGIRATLELIVQRAKADGAERKPGAWCKYCPALAHCPEARREVAAFAEAPLQLMRAMTPEQRGALLDMARLAEKQAAAVKAEAARLVKEGVECTGYAMTTRRGALRVEDALAAFVASDLREAPFMACVKVDAKKLIDATAKAHGTDEAGAMALLRDVVSRGASIEYLRSTTRKEAE